MRVVFFGTPDFAVPSLEAVAREHEIALVVAQPDRPSGRGMKLHKPPVAERAMALGLPLAQPSKIRTEEFLQSIAALKPDLGVVVAYGRILPKSLLDIPLHGFINVHGSILPKYRGAAPMQRAIEAGEKVTGVSIMAVEEELDSGPVYAIEEVTIGPDDRLPLVAGRIASAGARALTRVLREMPEPVPQDHAAATYAAKIEKEEGLITFREPAAVIYNRFRAFDPWPGIFFVSGGETVKITDMRVTEWRTGASPVRTDEGVCPPPGTILSIDADVVVATAEGDLRLIELQRPGKQRAAAGDVARGLGWRAGTLVP